MDKRMLLFVAVIVIALSNSVAMALSPMGPATATLKKGDCRAAFDYSYSDMDLELSGLGGSDTEDVETNMFLANLGYGIADNWEGFVRLGLATVEAGDFDSDAEFAYGFGTKVTFAETETVSWGVLFQIGWFEGEDTGTGFLPGFGVVTDAEIDAYEIQIAVAPTYKMDNMTLYGGPFIHLVDGDLDVKGPPGSVSFDIEQESEFGGYVGAEVEITANSLFNIEGQFTADAWAFGLSIAYRF